MKATTEKNFDAVLYMREQRQILSEKLSQMTKEEIVKWAKVNKANVHNMELSSQFRCNGSDGYLAWLDNGLQIKETANYTFDNFDFRVIDSTNKLTELIIEKNKINNKARMVAGYCWNWVSKQTASEYDIVIPEHSFSAKWNLSDDGMLWIISPSSINEIGCIHTCQGLELDYVGVIIGKDMIVRNNLIITNPKERAKTDQSLRGYLKQKNPDLIADRIIKNTYRTLMTRGMKGCYIYCVDKETSDYFKKMSIEELGS